ncbi:MAG: GNAT family N-acetyltransferase [bacterium]|nr:GNAT family N-acetyltransferase [bacterium]
MEPDTTLAGQRDKVHVWSSWNERASAFAKQVDGTGTTLFQNELWLSTWYQTFTSNGDTQAVIVAVEDQQSGELVLLLPLAKRYEMGLSVISFADFGLVDYNAPLILPDHQFDPQQLDRLMRDIVRSLPTADLLKLEKIPDHINNIQNPLCALNDLQKSNLCHYGIEITNSWEDYWCSLKRNFRKDQRRRWRVLEKKGEVSFVWCQNENDIKSLFSTLMIQQRQRLARLDLPYLLDNPNMKHFYEQLIVKGCATGPVIFTALLVASQPVATLCGFGNGSHYCMTVSGYETGEWSKCSPGRLLTERTMQTLHKHGYHYFDFTIGDEPYKQYFAIEQGTLHEVYRPLSWRGWPRYLWMRAKSALRRATISRTIRI